MKKMVFAAALAALALPLAAGRKAAVDLVNMMIGSDGANPTEYGGTTPAVSTPFGMTQWCAATRINGISRTMYHHRDTTLLGFMATHQPAIWMGDYGFMTLMPQCGGLKIRAAERRAAFDRADEVATPYYYKVSYGANLSNTKRITTELTATSHASFFRIAYPDNEQACLFLEAGRAGSRAGGSIEIVPGKNEIRISNCEVQDAHLGPGVPNFRAHYVLKFSVPFEAYGTWNKDGAKRRATQCEGLPCGGFVCFPAGTTRVEVRIGSSFISYEQALANLEAEIPQKLSFERTKERVRKAWNDKLSRVQIEGADDDALRMFYSAFVRTLQFPREFHEHGNRYFSPFDGRVHDGVSYTAFSLWDTFRAEHPWLQLVAPERINGMVQALVQMYEEGGWIPKWPNPTYTSIMIGSHADAVIADAYVNGFRGYDLEQAYRAIRKNAYVAPAGDEGNPWGDRAQWNGQFEARGGLSAYLKNGYVASDRTYESVSRTLEFALDDYCIAQMAKGLGHTDDYNDLMKRTKNYRHLFHPDTRFFRARRSDGSWGGENEGFTEGGRWTYRFCVLQDVPGLIELLGGNEAFCRELDKNFENGHYRHDNEPGHHFVYLYDCCGRLDKAQQRIPDILRKHYQNKPDGLSGNDDCGQMSAWYLFSTLGFYPLTPASGQYALGIPAFPKIRFQLPGGRRLTVRAEGLGTHATLTRVTWNGKPLDTPFIRVSDLLKGGELVFRPN